MSYEADFIHWWDRRLKNGYSDFGPIQIPPRPSVIQLTDRDDGSLWIVSFETSPVERISITQDLNFLPVREGARVYDASNGPTIDALGEYQLFIRGGRLGLDYEAFPTGETFYSTEPTYARQAQDQRLLNTDSEDPLVAHLGYIAP